MKAISRVEWGVIVFAALVIIGQTIRVYPQLLLFFGGLIAGVIVEKICRWRKARKGMSFEIDITHQQSPPRETFLCKIVPFPGETTDGSGA